MDGTTALVALSERGRIAETYTLIDAADIATVGQWRWHLRKDGYVGRTIRKNGRSQTILLHRFLLGLEIGDPLMADHINRNRLDNRRGNLRVVPREGNMQNVPGKAGTTSEFRGVSWSKARQQWRARIGMGGRNGTTIELGYFDDEKAAAEIAREARRRLMPYAID